jgi:hypothetical protein
MSLLDHMCSICNYYMPLVPKATTKEQKTGELIRCCKNCGNTEDEKKGLVMEMVIQDEASDAYKVFVNEFTKTDPRLPHVSTLKCPNLTCPSRKGEAESDVIYIKYDTANLKFLYICNICDTQWKSRS